MESQDESNSQCDCSPGAILVLPNGEMPTPPQLTDNGWVSDAENYDLWAGTNMFRPKQKKLYLIGSLRNDFIPTLARRLRVSNPDAEIFDDWYAAGPEADDYWKSYEQARGRSYTEALAGHAAQHVFEFDTYHLQTSTHALLVLPAGKSGHMELMYAAYGVRANTAILLEQGADPRWDVMYQFVSNVFETIEEVEQWLQGSQ